MRGLVWAAVALAATACYSPKITECTVRCAADNSCPSGTTCEADNFCHADPTASCKPRPDGPPGKDGGGPDAKGGGVADAPVLPDAPAGEIDAPLADAPELPDASNPGKCKDLVTTLDGEGDPLLSNLSVDHGDTVHITYVVGSSDLEYLRGGPAGFAPRERVTDAAAYLKGQTVDPLGGVHVTFTDGQVGSLRLRYAHRTPAGEWSSETITESNSPYDGTITVSTALNIVDVAYYASDFGQLWHARRLGANKWNNEVIDDGGADDVGEYPSLAVGPAGALVVTYRDVTQLSLLVATRGPLGVWTTHTLDDTSNGLGAYTALAIDDGGKIHVAYADDGNRVLKYLEATATGQVTRVVADDTDAVGHFNGIALDGKGGVHISSYAYGAHDLHYVHRAAGAPGFTVKNVDSADEVGRHSSIGIDSGGAVHISYIDDTNHALKYAVICPTR
jgi:hypothetical protein